MTRFSYGANIYCGGVKDSMLVLMIIEEDSSLIERYYLEMNEELMGVAYSILRSHYEAEAAVQEAFTKIMSSIESFRKVPDEKKSGYCYIVVKNLSISIYKQKKRNSLNVVMLDNLFTEPAALTDGVEERIEAAGDIAELQRLINHLEESLRKPLILRYVQELSYNQIAHVLKISEPLARKRVERAISKLKEISQEESIIHV
jgi:RNA polymerase sigma-70 factor (ECF subfamily)